MAGHADIYRALVRLYPKDFRRHYGDDLVQNFVDLLGRDGASRTWPRVTLDLVITVPRYRLETVMNQRQSTATLYVAFAALAGAGILSMLAGFYAGAILLAVAVVLGIVERGRLATSTRSPNPDLRRRLLIASAILAVVCVVATTAFMIEPRRRRALGHRQAPRLQHRVLRDRTRRDRLPRRRTANPPHRHRRDAREIGVAAAASRHHVVGLHVRATQASRDIRNRSGRPALK